MNLSREQIAAHAKAAGFTGADINIAVAVALAESGGNTNAHNATPPDDSYGLWQINMLGSMGPDRRKKFGITSNAQLYEPAVNAKAAKLIHAGSGWKAWTTYTRGTYLKYMDGSTPDATTPTDTPINSTSTGSSVLGGFNAFSDTIFKAASNFAGIIVAVVLLVLGVVILSRNVIPAGRVLKAVGSVKK